MKYANPLAGIGNKGNKWKWEKILGYSTKDLKLHLEKQFKDGMTWGNRSLWHIDHIIPRTEFNLNKEEDFKKCWALENLRPLWAKDNWARKRKPRHKDSVYIDLCVRKFNQETLKTLKHIAVDSGKTLSDVINAAGKEYAQNHGTRKEK